MKELVIILLMGLMILFCPDKKAHQKAINQRFMNNMSELERNNPDAAVKFGFLSAALGVDLNEMLCLQEYDNWGLFSTGSCAATRTIGILGMVFIIADGDTSSD